MVSKYCGGLVPNVLGENISIDNLLKGMSLNLGEQVAGFYEELAFSKACEAVLALVRAGNKFIDVQAPWSLYKQGDLESVQQVLYSVLESVRLASYLLSPIIPNISSDIYQQLGFSIDFNDQTTVNCLATFATHSVWGALPANQALGEAQPVFKRLELLEKVPS